MKTDDFQPGILSNATDFVASFNWQKMGLVPKRERGYLQSGVAELGSQEALFVEFRSRRTSLQRLNLNFMVVSRGKGILDR